MVASDLLGRGLSAPSQSLPGSWIAFAIPFSTAFGPPAFTNRYPEVGGGAGERLADERGWRSGGMFLQGRHRS